MSQDERVGTQGEEWGETERERGEPGQRGGTQGEEWGETEGEAGGAAGQACASSPPTPP